MGGARRTFDNAGLFETWAMQTRLVGMDIRTTVWVREKEFGWVNQMEKKLFWFRSWTGLEASM